MLGGNLALGVIAVTNKSPKVTRRPLAVLKFSFYQGSVASLNFSERLAPYHNVSVETKSNEYAGM